MARETDKSKLLSEIERVAEKIPHRPRLSDMKEYGEYSTANYYEIFGSWSDAVELAGFDGDSNPSAGISEDELIKDIQKLAQKLGRSPSNGEYQRQGRFSLSPVYRHFESWEEALEAAGLEILNFRKVTQISDKQELIDALRDDVRKLGHVPTRTELNKKGTFSDTTYQNHFGGYNIALKKAGFAVNSPVDTRREVECFGCGEKLMKAEWKIEDRDNIFCSQDCLHRTTVDAVCDQCGTEAQARYVLASDVNTFCDYSCKVEYYNNSDIYTIPRHCRRCGIEFPCPEYKEGQENVFCSHECSEQFHRVSENQLVEDYKQTAEELGHAPTVEEITEHCQHGVDTYYRNFDSLNEVVDAAGLERSWNPPVTIECERCGDECEKPASLVHDDQRTFCNRECYFAWMREGHLREDDKRRVPEYGPSWESQRRAARERDGFSCQSCGMSREEHLQQYSVSPHVHHITPWHEFDDHQERNKLSNLLTLCVDCHVTWEHLPVRPQVRSE
jgi:hypothetical protein